MHVLDAAGYDVVVSRPSGVGQDELEVTRLAHTTVVVTAPGMGDDIQAIKAGILEVADVFAVNKADRDGADGTVRDLEQMLMLGASMASAGTRVRGHAAVMVDAAGTPDAGGSATWTPPVLKVIATKGDGVDDLVAAIGRHRAFVEDELRGRAVRRRRAFSELRSVLVDSLLAACEERASADLESAVDPLLARATDPYTVAESILSRLLTPKEAAS